MNGRVKSLKPIAIHSPHHSRPAAARSPPTSPATGVAVRWQVLLIALTLPQPLWVRILVTVKYHFSLTVIKSNETIPSWQLGN